MSRRSWLVVMTFVVINVAILLFGQYQEKKHARDQFAAAFGCNPFDRLAAEIAVDYQLRSLADQACKIERYRHSLGADNYSLDVMVGSDLKRLRSSAALAHRFGYQIPGVAVPMVTNPKWPENDEIGELYCHSPV